jgi:signal transduction histidine kinase
MKVSFGLKEQLTEPYRWHYSQAIPFKDEHGNITAWIGTNIDYRLIRKKSWRKKMSLSGVASHELKTPLTSLKGYIQLMEFQENLSDSSEDLCFESNLFR